MLSEPNIFREMCDTFEMSVWLGLLVAIVILKTDAAAKKISITTTPKTFNSTAGRNITLPCYLQNADIQKALELSASWRKFQESSNKDGGKINNARNILSPFTPDRFSLVPRREAGGTNMDLIITHLRPEDSGVYKCSIYRQSVINGTVAHHVNVLSDNTSLILEARTDARSPERSNVNSTNPSSVIVFREGTNGFISCIATEVYPKPTLKIYIGKKQITQSFIVNISGPVLSGPTKYLQRMSYHVERFNDHVKASPEYHMQELKCLLEQATPGANDTVAKMRVKIEYKARVSCPAVQRATPDQTNFQLKCVFNVHPDPSRIQWTAEKSKETVMDGSKKNGLSASISRMGFNKFQAILTFKKVQEKSFQRYRLRVTNSIGWSEGTTVLEKGAAHAGIIVPNTLLLLTLPLLAQVFRQH